MLGCQRPTDRRPGSAGLTPHPDLSAERARNVHKISVQRILAGLVAAVVAVLLLTAPAAAQGVNTAILEFDEDGRVIGVKRAEGKAEDAARATDDEEEEEAAPRRTRTRRARGNDDPANRFEPNEILVANAPEGFDADARRLGFRIIERVPLRGLDMDFLRLLLPGRITPEEAQEILRSNFPSLLTDVNTIFEPGAANRPACFARKSLGGRPAAPRAARACALGLSTASSILSTRPRWVSASSTGPSSRNAANRALAPTAGTLGTNKLSPRGSLRS